MAALLIPAAAFSQPKKEEPKAPPVKQAIVKALTDAYGKEKGFCCQLKNGCLSGPKDGSAACRHFGGKPFSNSFCAIGTCFDP